MLTSSSGAACHSDTAKWVIQVDASAAARAAVQRRAPSGTEATTLPGGSPIFAAVADDVNKVLLEAMQPLQVRLPDTDRLPLGLKAPIMAY